MTFTKFDPSTKSSGVTLSNGDLTAASSGPGGGDIGVKCFAADVHSTGKYYFEVTVDTFAGGDNGVGVCTTASTYPNLGSAATRGVMLFPSGNIYIDGSFSGTSLGGGHSGHTIAFAFDLDNNLCWLKDITAAGNWNNSSLPDPATAFLGKTIPALAFIPAVVFSSGTAAQATFNTGSSSFTGTVPSGFTAGWPQPLVDVWLSVETPDTFSAVGYPGIPGIRGDLLVTEARDIFAAAGFQPNSGALVTFETPDHFSAFGFQPLTGTLTATEAHDVMHATGIGLGEDGVFITTEAVDIFAAVGNTPISGSFNVIEHSDRFIALGAGVTRARRRRTFIVT